MNEENQKVEDFKIRQHEENNIAYRSIKRWDTQDRPREKLETLGKHAVSNAELLAILIATGTGKRSAVQLAQDIMALAGNDLDRLGKMTVKEMQQVKGIGQAKAITIFAALELGRRRKDAPTNQKPIIRSSNDSFLELMPFLVDLSTESFRVLYLSNSNRVIANEQISTGGMTATLVDVRVILKRTLELNATAIICAHNHPSGECKPSKADIDITLKLKDAAKTFDVRLLDHLIVASNSKYYSFADEGLIN